MAELAPDSRAAFVLTRLLRLSHAEVEEVPAGPIRSRVVRARAGLVSAITAAQAG